MKSYQENAAQNTGSTMSRIENDVETVKRMTTVAQSVTERIIRHTRALGYFEPPSDPKASGPAAVVSTLADALVELDRALDHCSGSLNVFG
jgi:hypothetical protein